jgi:hypothetical protein
MNDLALLREFEPIVRFTRGELFFPRAVDEYVRSCSLWELTAEKKLKELVPEGELSLDKLATYDSLQADHVLYMRFIPEPLGPLEYQQWLIRPDRPMFKAPGRLARVPLLSRIGDSFFDLSLAVRGTVPGGTSAAAEVKMRELDKRDPRPVYYGRVVRKAGWIALHYLFFYPMNNWRSGFYGVNDHEADWEQILVFLFQGKSEAPTPMWVAYASHDFKGDELRRRWDDPLLYREGNHPIIFAGAGSHGSYFEPGEYVMGIEPEFLTPVKNGLNGLRKFWYETLRQGDSEAAARRIENLLSVPFVDYARGDGVAIGPGQHQEWSPILIDDDTPWVNGYRGLWGLDTQDLLGGERAPSGPKYNRDGSIRMSWFDPLGWAGVDKLIPPDSIAVKLEERINEVDADLNALNEQIEADRERLRDVALDVEGLRATEYFSSIHDQRAIELTAQQEAFQGLIARQNQLSETRLALRDYLDRVRSGDLGPPDAHLKHPHHPAPPVKLRRSIEFWAAISGALALLVFGYLLVFQPNNWIWWIIGVAVGFGAIDALARGQTAKYLLTAIITLAIISAVILFIEFWQWIIVAVIAVVVIYMIRDNLREIRL